jgi:hypothetical protein
LTKFLLKKSRFTIPKASTSAIRNLKATNLTFNVHAELDVEKLRALNTVVVEEKERPTISVENNRVEA